MPLVATWETVSTSSLRNGGTDGSFGAVTLRFSRGTLAHPPRAEVLAGCPLGPGMTQLMFEVSPHPETRHFLSFQTKHPISSLARRLRRLRRCLPGFPLSQSSCVGFRCLTPGCNAAHCFKPLTCISSFPKDAAPQGSARAFTGRLEARQFRVSLVDGLLVSLAFT